MWLCLLVYLVIQLWLYFTTQIKLDTEIQKMTELIKGPQKQTSLVQTDSGVKKMADAVKEDGKSTNSKNSKASSERRKARARSPDLRATEKNPFLKKVTVDLTKI